MAHSIHRVLGTWDDRVSRYLVLSEFCRSKLIAAGLPPEKLFIKPNFVFPDPGFEPNLGAYAIFAGRLTYDKGISTMLESWTRFRLPLPLKIVGDGPLAGLVARAAARNPGIEWAGHLPRAATYELIRRAAVLLVPSLWYEGMPNVILEAFAMGVPVIASRIGSLENMISDGKSGFLAEPGDEKALAVAVVRAASDPVALTRMRRSARQEYLDKYTPERNISLLTDAYTKAISCRC